MTAEKSEEIRHKAMNDFGFGPNAMKKTKICKGCGTISSSEKAFCGACGMKLPEGTLFQEYKTRHSYCEQCDTVVSEGVAYCPKCGNKIQGGAEKKDPG